jgi:hypothetical protein
MNMLWQLVYSKISLAACMPVYKDTLYMVSKDASTYPTAWQHMHDTFP